MSVERISEADLCIREATTRYVNITCKDKATGEAFDFDGYTVQTHLAFGTKKQYVPTAIVDNLVSYKIPAEISLGVWRGTAETRIFKDGDVFEVLRINVTVQTAEQPDIEPQQN